MHAFLTVFSSHADPKSRLPAAAVSSIGIGTTFTQTFVSSFATAAITNVNAAALAIARTGFGERLPYNFSTLCKKRTLGRIHCV
jgi:hypothetical protein